MRVCLFRNQAATCYGFRRRYTLGCSTTAERRLLARAVHSQGLPLPATHLPSAAMHQRDICCNPPPSEQGGNHAQHLLLSLHHTVLQQFSSPA